MAKLIVPKHTADLELIIPAIQVYYDDGGWVSMSDYKDRLFSLLKASGKEETRNPDSTHYTKCSEIPRYFGWLERKTPGNRNSDVRITDSGKQFYENFLARNSSKIHELVVNALESVSFGRNNEGCGSDCDIEAPNIIILASIILSGITYAEAACILEDTVYNGISASNAILNIQMYRNNGINAEPKIFHKDIKPIIFLRKLGFFKDDRNTICISKDVAEIYLPQLMKLPITRDNSDVIALNIEDASMYTKTEFLEEVYISADEYDIIEKLLKNKKNIVLQGAPGVGKTFAATRLAYSLIGKKDNSKVRIVQFHQSYSFEDFVVGYKPTENGFKLEYGVFYSFCEEARQDPENEYYFIIDEINRGNLSRIFGELLMLIENTKRGHEVNLLYTKEAFSVPKNLYIIGLMNTADRSLAMIDYALRRRFSFYTMDTAFGKAEFKKQIALINNHKAEKLIRTLMSLNIEIENDDNLGKGFKIGHSYLCINNADDKDLQYVINYEIIPLLEEYWYDEPSQVDKWSNELISSLK